MINIVLLSRFNGIVLVALSFLFFRTVIRTSEVVGYVVMAVGVTALVILNNGGFTIMTGELLVLASTVFFALTEFISKRVLRECSVEAYIFSRNLVSAVIFFVVAVYFFGFEHFADAFQGELWVLMLVYAGVAVVGAQLLWLKATPVLLTQVVANSQLLNPGVSIFFAYLLLNEVPTASEWLVMAVVVVGMLIPKVTDWERGRHDMRSRWTFGAGLVGTH